MDWLLGIGIALIILGFICAAVEMSIPGFGVPGIVAVICMVSGIFFTADTVMEGIFIALVLLVLLGAMLVIILWLLAKGKLRSPLILREEQRRDQGYIGSSDLTYLLGKRGLALTDLRPSGAGDFDGVRFDVLSEGDYIEKGSELEIIKVGGSKLIVKQAD